MRTVAVLTLVATLPRRARRPGTSIVTRHPRPISRRATRMRGRPASSRRLSSNRPRTWPRSIARCVPQSSRSSRARAMCSRSDAGTADMVVSFQISGYKRFVLSDERRIGAPSATQVLTPSGSTQLPPTSVVPREQTVGDGSMLVFVDDPRTGPADLARCDHGTDARALTRGRRTARRRNGERHRARNPGAVNVRGRMPAGTNHPLSCVVRSRGGRRRCSSSRRRGTSRHRPHPQSSHPD